MLYDKRDADAILPWADFLVRDFEVSQPAFSGDEREIRQYHDECLRTCDGVMIFYGAASDVWLGRKLNELQKSPGYGRTKRMPEVAICLIPPNTAEKARLRRKNAFVVPQWDGITPDALQPFVSAVKARGEEGQRDRDGAPV
jgi:tRNA-dihydrouridine synthase